MGRWVCKNLALLAGLGLLLFGAAAFGPWALEQLRPRERYRVAFTAIECAAPPGLSRSEFLDQVQYYDSQPDELELLDRTLPARLAGAFERHPWVERVEQVEVVPPRRVRVRLTFRTPALAVEVQGRLCVVDRAGVRLPDRTAADGLPRYPGQAPPPGPVGSRWGDAAVEAAAHQAAEEQHK
jgi:hypothetical protein